MSAQLRHNVHLAGQGAATMVFAHGFGCDQTMWRHLAPAYQHRYRVLTYDLVGSGGSDLSAYDRVRHATLQGHADDLLALIDAHASGPVVFVGHSVGATIGMLATIAAPERFAAQIMVSPSPCYINDGDYTGGFTRDDIDDGDELHRLVAQSCTHHHGRAQSAPSGLRADGQFLPQQSRNRPSLCQRYVPLGPPP
jgi:sigma-B regulation protein RsbQ